MDFLFPKIWQILKLFVASSRTYKKSLKEAIFYFLVNIHSDTHIYNPDKYFFNFLSRRCRFEFELNLPPTLEGKPIYHIIHPFDNSQWVKYGKNISINIVFVSVWKITSKAKIDYFWNFSWLNIQSWSTASPIWKTFKKCWF